MVVVHKRTIRWAISLFLVMLYFSGLTGIANADIESELVGWWAFNDGSGNTATDSSGNGIHGTLKPGQPSGPTWVAGMIDDALEFDTAKQNYVECGPHPALDITGSITLAAWVKKIGPWIGSSDPYRYDIIIYKRLSDGSTRAYRLSRDASSDGVCLTVTTAGGEVKVRGGTAVNDGQWHHIAAVYDMENAQWFIYVDAQEDTASVGGSASGNIQDSTGQPLLIGFDGGDVRYWGGLIDEVRIYSRALSPDDVMELYESREVPISPTIASNPAPADGVTDVPACVVLGWTPGVYANKHDVYFGTDFNDVNDAEKLEPMGPDKVYRTRQDADSYAIAEIVDFGKTYYWRIDEVNSAPNYTVFKGDVWQFTVELIGYPISNVTATASSSEAGKGPENTVNRSGLDANDLHSMEPADMWLSGDEPNAWIEYELDKVYKLHQMWVWNSNQMMESLVGFGLKDVTVEYSTNGTDYTTLGTTHEFVRASETPDYAHNTTVDFGGAAAKYVRLTANSNWGGLFDQYGLSEVRFFSIPVRAREPSPANEAEDVALVTPPQGIPYGEPVNVVLGWRAGREAAIHNVYFSTDKQRVTEGTALVASDPAGSVCEAGYDAGTLDLGQTYYWRVDEVNEAETPMTWEGDVWNFATPEFFTMDDFEDYNDYPPDEMWSTWVDGYGIPTNGSQVGHTDLPFAEQSIVHGGSQSMPFFYDNTGNVTYSEAEANISDLGIDPDWTRAGVRALTLYFHGDPDNAPGADERMYVKLNGVKVVYDGDMADIKETRWLEWPIDLASFGGVDPQNVTKISIGLDRGTSPGSSGVVYFDDIRLSPTRCALSKRSADFAKADFVGDCVVDFRELEVMAADWLLSDSVTPTKTPDDTKLEAYYKFDDGSGTIATDSSNNSHRAILDGPQWESIDVQVGTGALKFDGVDDRLTVDSFNVAGTGITLAVWIKPTAFGNDPRIISKAEGSGTAEHYWALLLAADPGDPEAGLQCRLRTDAGAATGVVAPSDEIELDAWAHVAATWDRDDPNIRLYKNGIEIYSVAKAGTAVATAGPGVRIGIGNQSVDVGPGGMDRPFEGIIDDVRIYDYGLSDPEIKYLATKGASDWYEPVPSAANLYDQEPRGQRKVNFKDYAVLMDRWLDEQLWP